MFILMSKRQFSALFFCSLVPATSGIGLIPLLPVYATLYLGVAPTVTGFFLAFTFFALACGTFVAGTLSDKFQRRKQLILICGLITIPVLGLMGWISNIWFLTLFTAIAFFLFGITGVLIVILTGLFADERERGKVFGILALTDGIGGVLGGVTMGQIADIFGYPTLFAILAVFAILLPFSAFFLKDKVIQAESVKTQDKKPKLSVLFQTGPVFFLLLFANTLAGISMFIGSIGRSLVMTELGFTSAAISSTAAVGGAVSLPFRPLLGTLSDRFGRPRLLALCYTATSIGLGILVVAISLIHFWIAMAFIFAAMIRTAVGAALVTDLTPQESLGSRMSLFNSSTWIGGIIGFSISGYAVELLGNTLTFLFAAFFPIIGIFLLIPIHRAGRMKK